MDIDDETLKQMLATIQASAIQGSATAQILLSLLMVLDVPTLQHIRATLQSRAEDLADGSEDRRVYNFALTVLDLAINGPAPKRRLRLVPGKDGGK